jgi:Protein of unknown function (DUF2971)
MILYKYLPPDRLDVLRRKAVRFTQPADFNDPFEFRPKIQALASSDYVRAHVEEHFETQVDEEVAKVPPSLRASIREIMLKNKSMFPALVQPLQPHMLTRVAPAIDTILNLNVGVFCLSELREPILMWGHYTSNHRGLVVGFESTDSFFSKRRSESDEFGFLRPVIYQLRRPQVTLADTTSPVWFQTKSDDWSYEKEWRIVRPLSQADQRIEADPYPICLFEFSPSAVREIIVGMRAKPALVEEVRSMAGVFAGATLLKAREDPDNYGLLFDELG